MCPAGWKGNHCLCLVGVLEVWWRHSKAWAGAGSIDWALVSVRTLHNQHQPSHQVGAHPALLTTGPWGLRSQTVAAIIQSSVSVFSSGVCFLCINYFSEIHSLSIPSHCHCLVTLLHRLCTVHVLLLFYWLSCLDPQSSHKPALQLQLLLETGSFLRKFPDNNMLHYLPVVPADHDITIIAWTSVMLQQNFISRNIIIPCIYVIHISSMLYLILKPCILIL